MHHGTAQICGNTGLPLAKVPCLHQRNIYKKRKLRKWSAQKLTLCFSANSPPRSTDRQSTRVHAAPFRSDFAKMRKHGTTLWQGTVSAPNQYLYEKEATGMESPIIESLLQCKQPTSPYGPLKHRCSCSAVKGRQCEYAETRGYLSPRYRVFTKAIFI